MKKPHTLPMLQDNVQDKESQPSHLPVLSRGRQKQQDEVILISMPFGILTHPSLGLSLLKGALASSDVSVKILYFTLRFAELIGSRRYQVIANGEPAIHDLIGEWIFAEALSGPEALDKEGYINDVLRGHAPAHMSPCKPLPEALIERFLAIRAQVDDFMDECLEKVLRSHPKIVGFTSVFQQHVASLALAKRIKAVAPETQIVFGGANCEGAMGAEMVRQFPFLDAVVSGEGDIIFPQLVQRMLEDKDFSDLQGVYTQSNIALFSADTRYPNAPSPRHMDDVQYPDFDDFFAQYPEVTLRHPPTLGISFETSRGCWWGEKNHCTFCGLNGSTMAYRSKSAQRALDELLYIVNRYPDYTVSVVDNILDMKYFKDFIPQVAALSLHTELFYEVKANLKKEQIQMLRSAGITFIQPGIESLSTPVLGLMRKGIKKLQNIQLLKWCKELGVTPAWNILFGFPGEPAEEYVQMAAIMPLLSHLKPPAGCIPIRLDRFSPNFDTGEQLGFTNIAPYPSYSYVYPFAIEHVANLAYFFTFDYREAQDVKEYAWPLVKAVDEWKACHSNSSLISIDLETHLAIFDLRPIATKKLTILSEVQRNIYLLCDGIHSFQQIYQFVTEHTSEPVTEQEIAAHLQFLVEVGFMLKEGDSYLNLAVPRKSRRQVASQQEAPEQASLVEA